MNYIQTDIEGPLIVEPRVFGDHRGYFFESFSQRDFEEHVGPVAFVQDNESLSAKRGVLRGLHFQKGEAAQAKLLRVVRGSVLDVAVDIRPGSPTFGKYVSLVLSGENKRQFFIPRGFAHGFSVLSEQAIFTYKCDNLYHPEAEGGLLLSDPDLAIDWQVPEELRIISDKDKKHPTFDEYTRNRK